jgi:hypothetical protein
LENHAGNVADCPQVINLKLSEQENIFFILYSILVFDVNRENQPRYQSISHVMMQPQVLNESLYLQMGRTASVKI